MTTPSDQIRLRVREPNTRHEGGFHDFVDLRVNGQSVGAGGMITGGVTEARVQEIINATSLSALQGMVTDGQIPAAIMRDAEFTAAAVRNLLGLTAAEVNDILVGAELTGSILTFTQNDGSTVAITLPATGMATADGVVASGAFSANNEELVLTLDTGDTVTIDVPAALRAAGGITQAAADLRYAQLSGASFTGAVVIASSSGGPLTVQGGNAGNSTIMKIFTPDSGTQKAFGAGREGEFDWVQFAGEVVTGKPGFALGPGTERDTNLYREAVDHLKTDDAFTAAGDLTTEGNLAAVGGAFTAEVQGVTATNDAGFVTKAQLDAAVAGTSPPSPQQEQIYYGIIDSVAEAATVDVTALTAADATVAGHDIAIGPSTVGDFFVFLVPAAHAILMLVNTGLNVNVLSTYTLTQNVRMLGTPEEQYHAYTFGPLNAGLTVNYRLTLTE